MSPTYVYNCQQCKRRHKGDGLRAPGKHVMGVVVMEQYVCSGCQKKILDSLSAFWPWDECAMDQCAKCKTKLEDQSAMKAHLDLDDSGNWRMVSVCKSCFAEFTDICKKNAIGG